MAAEVMKVMVNRKITIIRTTVRDGCDADNIHDITVSDEFIIKNSPFHKSITYFCLNVYSFTENIFS